MNTNGPDTIYLIRHGEKLGDAGNDKDGGPHLSIKGAARALALPSLFPLVPADPPTALSCAFASGSGQFTAEYSKVTLEAVMQPLFKPPDFLFATTPGTKPESSHRPLETITPLATALGLVPNTDYADGDVQCLADEVMQHTDYAGKVVLVCWHHGMLKGLAEAFGSTDVQKWDANVFDRVWRIDYSRDRQHLIDLPQNLLYGDSEK